MLAHIITIGDEILIGQIVDTNSAWMAQQLNLNGVRVGEIVSVSDNRDHILAALRQAEQHADLVLVTGGLGPTKDDITKKTLAEYFGLEMEFHLPSWENLNALFAKFNRKVDERYKIQCYMPVGATILSNKVGTAPGMWFERGGKVFVSMPGVPHEMQYLMSKEVLPKLKEGYQLSPIVHQTLLTVGVGETDLSGMLAAFEDALPPTVKLAYLPYLGGVRLRLTARGESEAALREELSLLREQMIPILGDALFGYEKESLHGVIGRILQQEGAWLATAESCTGGYLAHQIVAEPGASAFYKGTVVAYSNDLKIKILGVHPDTIATHGAVSEPTVKEMLGGILLLTGANYGIAISGIAGPDGGTAEKPVGTTWVAVGDVHSMHTQCLHLGRDRQKNIEMAGLYAFNALRKYLMKREK